MSFLLDTYKNVIKKEKEIHNPPTIKVCMVCFEKFKLQEPLIVQSDDNNLTAVHLTCFMKEIKKKLPEFWKNYLVELI